MQVVKDNEVGALISGLEGNYVEPGPGGDPIRNPSVLPTGKNIHALDPQSIPTAAAVMSAEIVVERLLEREKTANNGLYPESIAVVLWGTDNIKTYGESLAQVGRSISCRTMLVGVSREDDRHCRLLVHCFKISVHFVPLNKCRQESIIPTGRK